MIRSGTVTHVDHFTKSGVIKDNNSGREFYFGIYECCDNELPKMYSTVTFVKDPDYKATDVASLIKTTNILQWPA